MEWLQVLTIIGANILVLFGFIGTVIVLHLHVNKRIDNTLTAMFEEMKDFHARLCVIESKKN